MRTPWEGFREQLAASLAMVLSVPALLSGQEAPPTGHVSQEPSPCCTRRIPTDPATLEVRRDRLILLDVRAKPTPGAAASTAYYANYVGGDVAKALAAFLRNKTPDELAVLLKTLVAGQPTTKSRLLWTAGDSFQIYVVYDLKNECEPRVKILEQERGTRLADDLKELVKIVVGSVSTRSGEPEVGVLQVSGKLNARRAVISFGARSVPTRDISKCEVESDACADGVCRYAVLKVVSGPKEHLFLSVDVPLSKVSSLKYDSATGTVSPRDAPTKVYAGINWMVGDVVEPSVGSWSRPLERIVVKGLIEASAKPSNSFGVAIGFRPPPVQWGGLSLDSVQVFGGYVWTREDGVAADGQPRPDVRYTAKLRWGLSFNVDKLKSWLKL